MQLANSPHLDAKMSDICYSTAAAPTYFPPLYFVTNDTNGNQYEFNLIDGGVAAFNPVYTFDSNFDYFNNITFSK